MMKKLILGLLIVFVVFFGCTSQASIDKTKVGSSTQINANVNATIKTNVTANATVDKEFEDLFKTDLDQAITDLEEVENLSE